MDAAQLVKVYIKIRDAKEAMEAQHKQKVKELDDQLDALETELLTICKETGQDGGKTEAGTFTRTVSKRFWTSDWDSMYTFIRAHGAPELLERRIHQGNFKEFLEANPELMPQGVNVDSKYSIVVRRPRQGVAS
jgi:hypothetical protein